MLRNDPPHPRAARLAIALGAATLTVASFGVPGAASAEPHAANPFTGATSYVNPDYTELVEGSAARTADPALRARMEVVGSYPTAVWLDRIAAIGGGEANGGRRSLRDHLTAALAQQVGDSPITATIVVYDLPGRDCAALASNGELPLSADGLARYKADYIDAIAEVVGDPAFADIRVVAVIEPDGLPNLTTNLSDPECARAASSGLYVAGVRYALERLHAISNVYTYLDIAHSGWLGWDDNRQKVVSQYTEMARGIPGGFANVDGFVTNTSNYTPLDEPHLPDPAAMVGGQPVRSSSFYEWNPMFDELDFTSALHAELVAAGWPADIGFLIDTSRNGWGGPGRPSAPSTASGLDAFVDGSRIDRRAHRGLWCNVAGAGLGAPPQTAPSADAPHVDALVWVKPPGESDGASTTIPNDEGKSADPMCDPDHTTSFGTPTGALPGAPLAGHWFHEQFTMLVANAHPAGPGSPGGGDDDTVAPGSPAGLAVSASTHDRVSLSWSSATDDVGVVGYDVIRDGEVVGSTASTTYTDSGLAASTSYRYAVRARDAAGNASVASADVAAVTLSGPPTPEGVCTASFRVENTWNAGGIEQVTVDNLGPSIDGWTFVFVLPPGQKVLSLWNGTYTQSGQTVTVKGAGWNRFLASGGSATFGLQFSYSGGAGAGSAGQLNGVACK